MDKGYKAQGLGALMKEVCDIVNNRIHGNFYHDFLPSVAQAPRVLKGPGTTGATEASIETGECGRTLTQDAIIKHYKRDVARKTLLLAPCIREIDGCLLAR